MRIPMSMFMVITPRAVSGVIILFVLAAGSLRAEKIDFEKTIQPILARHCFNCHGAEKQRGGFRLDVAESALNEADSGEAPIVPGDSDKSELMRRIESDDDGEWMPPEGSRLTVEEVSLLKRWIDDGARRPESQSSVARGSAELVVTEADRRFWSFRPLANDAPPDIEDDWIRNPVDRFVLRRLHQKGLHPGQPADPIALQRRMYFDVIGLPPSAENVQSATSAPEKFDANELADRLLNSKHFGERWARHWLDVARYADSDGYEADRDRPHAYQYRDFVIRAFNEDMPFDKFVRWQLAGDELAPDDANAVVATGFLAAGPVTNGGAPTATDELKKAARYDELDDIVGTTAQAFLGLTLACARCHDHKFDPIPTRDYYRMVAAFATTTRRNSPPERAHRELDIWVKQSRHNLLLARIARLGCTEDEAKWLAAGPLPPAESKAAFGKYGKRVEFSQKQWRDSLSEKELRKLQALEAAVMEAEESSWETTPAQFVTDQSGQATAVHLLQRGSVALAGDETPLGFLTVLTNDRSPADFLHAARQDELDSTYHRAALANWMTDPERGAGALLARVAVNRIWHHYFGRGLAATPNDFGSQGERPSHPELLDWLATELIRNGWKQKAIHRLILNSNTYRQSHKYKARAADIDPENRLLWRKTPRRLDAEAMRDAVLAASGRLNVDMYGPPIRPFVPSSAMATRSRDKWPLDVHEGPAHWRRSIYIFVKRSIRFPMLEVFDAPDPTASCGRRISTTVPVQALTLLNNPAIRDAARDFARSIRNGVGDDAQGKERITLAFQRALGRNPTASEMNQSKEFLASSESKDPLTDLCHTLFTLNEFVYVD